MHSSSSSVLSSSTLCAKRHAAHHQSKAQKTYSPCHKHLARKPPLYKCFPRNTYSNRGMKILASGENEVKVAEEKTETTKDSDIKNKPLPGSGVNLFDPAATASRFITRRFGILGGLGFVAALASVEGWEIVKAILEKQEEGSGELVELPSGLSYRDMKIGGGGSFPKNGDFIGLNLVIKEGDEILFDSKKSGRPVAFTFGKRPFGSFVCPGLEEGVSDMKRGGVRDLIIPPELAFGEKGRVLPNGSKVSPGATLEYNVAIEDITAYYNY